jgi:hypothetical protein
MTAGTSPRRYYGGAPRRVRHALGGSEEPQAASYLRVRGPDAEATTLPRVLRGMESELGGAAKLAALVEKMESLAGPSPTGAEPEWAVVCGGHF